MYQRRKLCDQNSLLSGNRVGRTDLLIQAERAQCRGFWAVFDGGIDNAIQQVVRRMIQRRTLRSQQWEENDLANSPTVGHKHDQTVGTNALPRG